MQTGVEIRGQKEKFERVRLTVILLSKKAGTYFYLQEYANISNIVRGEGRLAFH